MVHARTQGLLVATVAAALLVGGLSPAANAGDDSTLSVTGVVAKVADGDHADAAYIVAGNSLIPVAAEGVEQFAPGTTVRAELVDPDAGSGEDSGTESSTDEPLAVERVIEVAAAAVDSPARHYVDVVINTRNDGKTTQPSNSQVSAAIAEASDFWVANTNGAFPGFTVRSITRYASTLSCSASDERWWEDAARQVGTDLDEYLVADSSEHLLLIGECRHDSKVALGSLGDSLASGGVVLTQADLFTLAMGGDIFPGTLAHELGHNFGLNHANATRTTGCDFTKAAIFTQLSACGTYEYADEWSVMGFALPLSWVPILDVARRDQLGVSSAATLASQTGVKSTTYELAALGASGGLKGVKVTVASGTYYVEYRTATGEPDAYYLDSGDCVGEWEPSPTCSAAGTIIPEGPGVRVLLQQADAATRVEAVKTHAEHPDFAEFALDAGDWWRSAAGDLNVSIDEVSGDSATVTVTTGALARVALSGVGFDAQPTLGVPVSALATAPGDASLTYRWYRNGAEIVGATGATYTPVKADVATSLTVRVEARAAGKAPTQVAATASVRPTRPTLSGTVRVGSSVTAAGAWPEGATLTYQWLRDGAAISGATSRTYKPTTSDYAKRLSVRVTGTGEGWGSVTLTSATAAVAAGVLTAATPKIVGTVAVGRTVSVSRGTWTSGTTFTYRWYANGVAISGATKSTYTIPASKAGKKISVKVTGTKTAFATKSVTSATKGVPIVGKVTITGVAKVGRTLTAHHGTWTSGTAFTYQWYANGVAISGATKSTYKVPSSRAGKYLTVRVTGKKSGYTTAYRTSARTARVAR